MNKRENPMAVRSKAALSQSLLRLMLRQDFSLISIADICSGAGLARQTFYTNFSKKEDILNYMLAGLFDRYKLSACVSAQEPDSFIIDYFMYWDKSKSFLTLLFRQELGYLFQERNRVYFMSETEELEPLLGADEAACPYIRASIAGMTYELLRLWLTSGLGLDISVLTAVAANLLAGRLFSKA